MSLTGRKTMSDGYRPRNTGKYGTTTHIENEEPLIKDLASKLQLNYKELTLDVINRYNFNTKGNGSGH